MMTKERLIEIAKLNKEHAINGTMRLVEDIVKVPASNYYDPERWEKEIDLIFKRLPLVLAVSKELPNAGDYKAMEVVGVPASNYYDPERWEKEIDLIFKRLPLVLSLLLIYF